MSDLIATVAVINANYATKAELAGAVYQLTWRMAGFAVAIVGAVAAVVRYA